MKTEDEEAQEIEEEAEHWRKWKGDTNCFGLFAKCVLLLLVIVKAVLA